MIRVELRHEVLERVPGGRVRPLHIVEDEHERARCRGESNVFDDFLVQGVLATRSFGCRLRAVRERGNEAR